MSEMSLGGAFIGIKSWDVEFVTSKMKINRPVAAPTMPTGLQEGEK
jgi:hypothetical protein